jgi:predicted HTH domain antitoxin
MGKTQKTLSIRIDPEEFAFLNHLMLAEKTSLSEAVRRLLERGRVMLAVERYREGKVSLGRAAELAGLSISETIDVLAQFGVASNLEYDDYLRSLRSATKVLRGRR